MRGCVRLKQSARSEFISPIRFATAYAALGQKDEAFRYLEQAFEQHLPSLGWLKTSPTWDPLRSDPRYQDLLCRIRYPNSTHEH